MYIEQHGTHFAHCCAVLSPVHDVYNALWRDAHGIVQVSISTNPVTVSNKGVSLMYGGPRDHSLVQLHQ